ncbi:hypothetical protein RUND412_009555 [Rhizina undulata]
MDRLAPSAVHGRDVLVNPVILECIIPALPHARDVCSLSLVSRQIYLLVKSLHPLYTRELSFNGCQSVGNQQLLSILCRPLRNGRGSSSQRYLHNDGRATILAGGPTHGYAGAWRCLRDLDLSGTKTTTKSVKLLIASTAGGKIPGLDSRAPSNYFEQEFGENISGDARRLFTDQSLRLERLCVKNCPKVDIDALTTFLKEILIAATRPRHHALQLQAILHAQNNSGPNGAFPIAPIAYGLNAQELLALIGRNDEIGLPYLLPTSIETLEEFGLPCFSLRRLEVANVNGLWVDPPAAYRGKKEWKGEQECPFGGRIKKLNAVAGCLGLDVDVLFCQGAGCSASALITTRAISIPAANNNAHHVHMHHQTNHVAQWHPIAYTGLQADAFPPQGQATAAPANANTFLTSTEPLLPPRLPRRKPPGDQQKTYDMPLPRNPNERVIMGKDRRIFRVPSHCFNLQSIQRLVLPPTLHGFIHPPPQGDPIDGFIWPAIQPNMNGLHPLNVFNHVNALNHGAANPNLIPLPQGPFNHPNIFNHVNILNHHPNLDFPHTPLLPNAVANPPNPAVAQNYVNGLPGNATQPNFHGMEGMDNFIALDDALFGSVNGDAQEAVTPGSLETVQADTSGDQVMEPAANSEPMVIDTVVATVPEAADPTTPSSMEVPLNEVPATTQMDGSSEVFPFGIPPTPFPGLDMIEPVPLEHEQSEPEAGATAIFNPPLDIDPSSSHHGPLSNPHPQHTSTIFNDPSVATAPSALLTPSEVLPPSLRNTVSMPRRNENGHRYPEDVGHRPRIAREIAMLDGPRGLCERCGREVWLCEYCNRFWLVICGACAGRL